ncbi:hypothetical protein [Polyangium sp. 6x1]|uniref:hypothetical protein n=1 Tax=Polyangium sp. 6x1 TaxID=3042689 RepID=UPI0024827C4B|nr:hypothetical protein [Polyangium sp. 6x1]MDI1444275.1 hypothetical protein [Polyangium sp. 6x1]
MAKPLLSVVSVLALLSSAAAGCGPRVVIDANDVGDGAGGVGNGNGGAGGNGNGSGSGNGSGMGGGGVGASGSGAGSSVSSGSGGMICPSFGDPCTSCLSVSCSAVYCDCHENPDCFQLITCTNQCGGDDACEQTCHASFPNGAADVYALSSCGGASCPSECPNTEPLDPCSQCMVETCDDELNGCLADAPCIALYSCLQDCADLDLTCQKACYEDHGAGVPKLEIRLPCVQTSCDAC